MSKLSRGKYAKAISDRSGMEFPYHEMVKEWNGSLVHVSEFEPKQPQLEPKDIQEIHKDYQMQDLQEQNLLHRTCYQVILFLLLQVIKQLR